MLRGGLVCGVLGLLMLPGCSSQSTASGHAYVVVQHLSGAWFERRVNFNGGEIGGQALMDQSGIEYQAQAVTSGKVVCQVDSEPLQYSSCFPQNQPYWALFIDTGGHWSSAPGGFTDLKLHDGDAMGWHYVRSGDPSPAPPPLPT